MGVQPLTASVVESWLRRKYTQRQDARQASMGLSYTNAETSDLAKEIANFVNIRIASDLIADAHDFVADARSADL